MPAFTVEIGDHAVQFYEDQTQLVRTVSAYIIGAVQAGHVAIVIATEDHKNALTTAIASETDVPEAVRTGRLVLLDARETLSGLMTQDRIDVTAFHAFIGTTFEHAFSEGRPIRAYGEMVALLWEAGNVLAAIELEELWNDLGRGLPLSLLCAYPAASVFAPEHAEGRKRVCHLHSSVINGSHHGPVTATQLPAEFGSVGTARHFVIDALTLQGHDEHLVADAALIVTELATNAVVHARSPFSVEIQEGTALRIAVRDHSPGDPTLMLRGPMDSSGRGLRLVAALACRWGTELAPDGKVVWAEMDSARYG